MSRLGFEIETRQGGANTARTGRLRRGSSVIETPAFVGPTSRGALPHVTPDLVDQHTALQASYVGLEDFLEKGVHDAPIFSPKLPPHAGSRLRSFTAYSDRQLLILGARRAAPVTSPNANSNEGISISTSIGFRELALSGYYKAATELGADIVVGVGDIAHGERAGKRRQEKMFGRSERWMQELVAAVDSMEQGEAGMRAPAIFAPIMPVDMDLQRWYIELLADDLALSLSGLAIYDRDTAVDLPESLAHLPRMSLTTIDTPHRLLQELSYGIDLFTAPFVTAATDAGLALDFRFPAPDSKGEGTRLPLGIDMWAPAHAKATQSLSAWCKCYACVRHSRAYVRHLLVAKEMLAWVLLQIHNLHIIHEFFKGVRRSLRGASFVDDSAAFEASYETDLPEQTGVGPRVRGYHLKSEGPHESKKNAPAFKVLGHDEEGATSKATGVVVGNEAREDEDGVE